MTTRKIEGIHNYCDRWCERCTFTSRCAVYEDESDLTPEEHDIANKAFWERISKNFAKAREMLETAAEQAGIDLSVAQEEAEESFQKRKALTHKSRQHPLAMESLQYAEIARAWLKTQPGMLDRLENLKAELNLGVESAEGARRETNTIKDSLAVIQWYLSFIHVKLSRAIMSKLSNAEWRDEEPDQRDCDGSAKIALIAIERSMHAWSALFDILPENEDDFLSILSILERIKTLTLAEFPNANAFVRPGFDTGDE